ncbi:MAG: N-acetylglutamate synthase (EC [uncultured Thiotrichaceae bacterium]|uniref:Amino-acid acetyltransferase n=1 Tax=uncultured Thiotrichaceae bacterium TaxID=298394 RepID=A0A6S6T769_9GAMM|nr:MAG: N-acetylglutamate synthase (EC [uncultured Thiotrichaceae bacterium]
MKKNCTSIDFFREASPYIQQHRGKTFVLALSGEVIKHPQFNVILQDIAILSTLGVKVILVHGSRPQVDEELKALDHDILIQNDLRITDDVTLKISTSIIGTIRLHIENMLTNILNTPPIINEGVGVLSGNLITAKPLGIIDGTDYQHTGEVRKINTQLINTLLDQHNIVMLSPLGFSPTGQTFNLRYEQIASFTAKALQADKLIFLHAEDFSLPQHTRLLNLAELIHENDTQQRLFTDIDDALSAGVQRIHLINADMEGGLLMELYTRDGIGAMFSADQYEEIHSARIDNVSGILELIRPHEEKGILVKRSREQLELEINNFAVIERDHTIIGCAACYRIPDTDIGEIACLAIHPDYRGNDRGGKLLDYLSGQAKARGIEQLLVLTTQTTDWFRERGFKEATVNSLPESRKAVYNFQRNSNILIRDNP